MSVWGVGGRVEMTVSKFMAIQQALQPDWFQCLSDGEASCAEATSLKRARKSVDRSLLFLDDCLRLQEESEVRLYISPLLSLKLLLIYIPWYHLCLLFLFLLLCSLLLSLYYSLQFFFPWTIKYHWCLGFFLMLSFHPIVCIHPRHAPLSFYC